MQRVSDVYSRGLIRALLPLTLITCGLWLSGCGASKAAIRIGKAWPSVHMGMRESDVQNILGKPTSSENNYEYKDGIGRKNECWNYPAGGLHYYQVCFSNGTLRAHHHHAFRVAAKNYYG